MLIQCICVFCADLRTNVNYNPILGSLICVTETQSEHCAVQAETSIKFKLNPLLILSKTV
jgi:hypothetical protein